MSDALPLHASRAVVEFDSCPGYWSLLSLSDTGFKVAGQAVEEGRSTFATFLFGHCITVTVPVRSTSTEDGTQSFTLLDASPSMTTALHLLASRPPEAVGYARQYQAAG